MKFLIPTRVRGLVLALSAAGAILPAAISQAQPIFLSSYPDGTVQFQQTNSLFVSVSSATGPTSFSIKLTGTNLTGTSSSNYLTVGHGLTLTTSGSTYSYTAALNSNTLYYALMAAADASGPATNSLVFDTVIPIYTWEAEDYDYGGGQFFDNPQTNAYLNLYATLNVDAFNPNAGGAAYRPVNDGTDMGADLGTETTGDIPRAAYINSAYLDYDQGWNNGGSGLWGNYTRHYPTGKWNIVARTAGSSGGVGACLMYQGGISGTLLGQFNIPNTGGFQNYTWVPLTDVAGNPVEWDTDGSKQTLTIQVGGGGYNMNYYMLVPVNPNYKPVPFVSDVVPNSATNVFTPTNVFSFVANSVPGLATTNIVVTENGVTPNGLTFSGSPHGYTVRFPMQSNVVYSVSIKLTDANGSSTYNTVLATFQTNNYTWEAEDWDYSSAQYFDNPQVDAYVGLSAVPQVDANNSQGGNSAYRPSDTGNLGNENCGDAKRTQYVKANTNDYDVGWTSGGNWANYTRHYPAGTYNVYMRGASPNGQNDACKLYWVTNGVGTATQGLSEIGQFNVPLSGGWQSWLWAPMTDANGNLARITNSGNLATLRMNEDNGGWNGNFFILVPPDTGRPTISGLYPNGRTQFQRTNTLAFEVTSTTPLTASAITLKVNGVVQSNLVITGTSTDMNVSWPNLQSNSTYSVSLVVNTPANDAALTSFTFDTFDSSYYTWEAEDFDYGGGKFFDNPQLDSYFGLFGTAGIDANNNTAGGTAYRSNDGGDLSSEVTGDVFRAQYLSGGTNDYDIGWTASGQWADYTRTFPKGTYNVYMRVASPGGAANAASLWQVTAGAGTANQTTNLLGHFNAPNTGSYQAWSFTPLVDSGGNKVFVTTTGSPMTFQLNEQSGNWNMNYFILVPAVQPSTLVATLSADHANLIISWSPAGHNLYSSPTLGANATWTLVGPNNPATIPITGSAKFFYLGQ